METINTDKLPTADTGRTDGSVKNVSVQESVMVGRLLQNTVQKLSQEGLEAINVGRALQSIKGAFPSEFSQIQVQNRQAQINNPAPNPDKYPPLSQQTKNSWYNGQVVAASVVKTNSDGSASVVIDKQTVDIKVDSKNPLKLEVGQRLALTIEKSANKPISFALSHTPEQSAKLLQIADSSANQQRALSPMLATLDAIVQRISQVPSGTEKSQLQGNKSYPEGFVKAVQQLVGQISTGQQLSNSEGLKQAVSQSGVFLENNIKINQTESVDLKQLNNLIKSSETNTSKATKPTNQPLSQSLQQIQKSSQQLSPRINNQVNISPESSQALQKAFSQQQQQMTLSLKSELPPISKPELMSVLQSISQIAAKTSSEAISQTSISTNTANSDALKQLQLAIKQLVMDTNKNSLPREQITQLNTSSKNMPDLANTLKTLANSIQSNNQTIFAQTKPLVQAVSQAVITFAGDNIKNAQLAVLKQNPQSIATLSQQLKTASQVVESLPAPEIKSQMTKVLQSVSKAISNTNINPTNAQFERVMQQINQATLSQANRQGTNQSQPAQTVPNQSGQTQTIQIAQQSQTAEQLAAIKMLREAVNQPSQTTNPAVIQAITKAINETAQKVLPTEQLNRLVEQPGSTKELSQALKTIEEKLAKAAQINDTQTKQVIEKVSQAVVNNADKTQLSQMNNAQLSEAAKNSAVKTPPITQAELSLALKNIAQNLDKNTLENNHQIKQLIESITRNISDNSSNNLSPKLLESLLQQPLKVADLKTALNTLQNLIGKTPNSINSFPAQLLQSVSQLIANNAERILQPQVINQLQQQPKSVAELQAKLKLIQQIINSPNDSKLFKPGQEGLNHFIQQRMTPMIAQHIGQNAHNPIPAQQLSQLLKQPLSVPQLMSALQALNQPMAESSTNNLFVNNLLQNISQTLNQTAKQGVHFQHMEQFSQVSQKIPQLLTQLTSLTQAVEQNRPNQINNISQPYPQKFVQAINQFIQQISEQFTRNNQQFMSEKNLSFIRSQVNNFNQQLQQISQTINQSMTNNPVQSTINQQIAQDFRVNIQRLLGVLQQIPTGSQGTMGQAIPASSSGQPLNPLHNLLPGSESSQFDSTKEMPLATKTKHAQVIPAQQNPVFQLNNLASFQQAFAEQLEGVLSRLLATQAGNREQADSNINMTLEIPFRFQEKSQVLQLKMSSKKHGNDDTDGKIWTANLAFELQSLGPIRVYVTLDDKDVAMQFWTENPSSQAIFKENFSLLTERLSAAGYRISQLGSYLGIPEEAQQEIKKNKLGVVDEHV